MKDLIANDPSVKKFVDELMDSVHSASKEVKADVP
eukprot:CAMPEP_0196805666 /NCGR_PEP_ID=MMETSP1362-20130617/5467_1 /TAXON_ID=163516 /ORGANISM="Leptocylindrus danicus, Strain CCMP1856" /LENGTH=34 /DNA_ID= /DNA_START= /DNA_END= /DNA_ORIENTATION=